MFTFADKFIYRHGPAKVARYGAFTAYAGWSLAIVFGCAGGWDGQIVGLAALIGTLAHLLGGRAQILQGN